jgi:hypothetical protein
MKTLRWLPLALVAIFLPLLAQAATATINWTAPATAIDGSPLTGQQAITGYQVWVSTATIPSNTTMTPTATITGTATTTTQSITANPGATIYTRVKACNAVGCSDFSTEASKTLPVSPPGVPTSVTITLSLQ